MGNVGTESDNIPINGCDLLWKEKHPSSLNFPRFTVKKNKKCSFSLNNLVNSSILRRIRCKVWSLMSRTETLDSPE